MAVTAANIHDSQLFEGLLHGQETRIYGDSAYSVQAEILREHVPHARDFTQRKGHRYNSLTDQDRHCNQTKSEVRAKRYRGSDVNANHVFAACALINVVMAKT